MSSAGRYAPGTRPKQLAVSQSLSFLPGLAIVHPSLFTSLRFVWCTHVPLYHPNFTHSHLPLSVLRTRYLIKLCYDKNFAPHVARMCLIRTTTTPTHTPNPSPSSTIFGTNHSHKPLVRSFSSTVVLYTHRLQQHFSLFLCGITTLAAFVWLPHPTVKTQFKTAPAQTDHIDLNYYVIHFRRDLEKEREKAKFVKIKLKGIGWEECFPVVIYNISEIIHDLNGLSSSDRMTLLNKTYICFFLNDPRFI